MQNWGVYILVMVGVWATEDDGLTGDASFSAALVVEIVRMANRYVGKGIFDRMAFG